MCFYCDREVNGNPQPWWYANYVCWTCRVQNGLKNDPLFLPTKKQRRSVKLYFDYLKTQKKSKNKDTEIEFEKSVEHEIDFQKQVDTGRICYKCNNPMVDVGFKFKTPKKNDIKQWKHLQETWEVQQQCINGVSTYVGPKVKTWKQSF